MVELKTTKEPKKAHCYRCEIALEGKPLRLCLQEYGIGKYKQYTSSGTNIDLCNRCFKEFVEWLGDYSVKKKV